MTQVGAAEPNECIIIWEGILSKTAGVKKLSSQRKTETYHRVHLPKSTILSNVNNIQAKNTCDKSKITNEKTSRFLPILGPGWETRAASIVVNTSRA